MGATTLTAADRRRGSAAATNLAAKPRSDRRFVQRLQTTLGLGLVGSFLMFAALPPLNLWPLAWIAPTPWLLLIRQTALEGKRPYRALWLAGFVLWLGAIHWLRLPHPLTHFGWLALAFYLALYLPVFVVLSRVAIHRLGISVVFAAPVVWTGLELARGHLLSGFTMGNLSHTQIHWLAVIQGADVVGDYGISGLVMLVAACIARMSPWRGERGAVWPILLGVLVLGSAVAYGHWRMSGDYMRPGPTVALVQGSIDAEVKADNEHVQAINDEYMELSRKALQSQPNLDLLVWPETMFRIPMITYSPEFKELKGLANSPATADKQGEEYIVKLQKLFDKKAKEKFPNAVAPNLLLGTDAYHFRSENPDRFNSAQFIDREGKLLARYDKMHPVMFGEYIPLAEYIPFLYKITPLTGGLTAGTTGVSQKLGDVRYAPNICYETVVPHLIRRQVVQLKEQNEEPDVLVNLTNDGWFRGSSELDMHLACGVFRAVEMRKPLVIAANTGLSASIDGDGRIVMQGARRAADVLIAEVKLDTRQSVYLQFGDWFSGICLAGCVGLAIVGVISRRKAKSEPRP